MSIIGVHIINGSGPHLDDLRRLQPRLVLVLDPNADDVRALQAACPRAVIVGRIYVPDSDVESRIRANPEAAARWAHELTLAQNAYPTGVVDFWQVQNEILQFWDGLPLLNRFEIERMRLAESAGYRCAILGFSVGQPDLPVNDRLALWRLVYPALAAAEARKHIVALHQYGAPDLWGPAAKGGAPWLSNRLETQVLPHLPFKVLKFAVTEYGIDGLLLAENERGLAAVEPGIGIRVTGKNLSDSAARAYGGPAGWQRYTDAAGYAKQLFDMGQWLAQFSERVIGYAVFTLGSNAPWGSYDIGGSVLRLLADHYAVASPPEPIGALPEQEPVMTVSVLADKCRWWLEESVRQDEAGNTARATAIRYSLIKRDGGLFYRLENALKRDTPTG